MIEVVFSQSAYGSLKSAQRYGIGNDAGGVGFVIPKGQKPAKSKLNALRRAAELQARSAWEHAVPLGGNPADVYCIDAAWSIGDISDCEIGGSRRSVLERLFFVYPQGAETDQQIETILQSAQHALHQILNRASDGEPIRIWYSHNPDEMCGFYWLLAQLRKKSPLGSIYAVKLPEWEYLSNETLCTHIGWGEISPGEWGKYLSFQQEVKPALLTACAMRWTQLQEENAPLRIYLNGRLQSAPESMYDSFILREADALENRFSEAELIGRILGKNQLGIGDAWIALRIEQFIQDGRFDIVTPPNDDGLIYRRILRKCND